MPSWCCGVWSTRSKNMRTCASDGKEKNKLKRKVHRINIHKPCTCCNQLVAQFMLFLIFTHFLFRDKQFMCSS